MKPWYQSKTIWANIATSILAVGNELTPLLDIMEPETSEQLRAMIIVANVIANIILRFVTKSAIGR